MGAASSEMFCNTNILFLWQAGRFSSKSMGGAVNSIGLYLMHQIPLSEELHVVNKDIKEQSNQTSVLIWDYCFACRIAERGLSLGGSDGGVSSVLLLSTFFYCQGKIINAFFGAEVRRWRFFPSVQTWEKNWFGKVFHINSSASSVTLDFCTFAICLCLIISSTFLELILSLSGNSCYSRTAKVCHLKVNYSGSQYHVKIVFL